MATSTHLASENIAPYAADTGARAVKLFRNGANQAVRIPKEFELPGTDALMRREGKRITEVALAMHTPKVDRSQIFRSWANAVRYMAVSSLLSIAHGRRASTAANIAKSA